MITYKVSVTREEGSWVAVVDGVRGGATQVRRLSALDGEVRDLLSGLLDLDENSLHLIYDYSQAIGIGAVKAVAAMERSRQVLLRATSEYDHDTRSAADELRAAGVSLRDSGTLMGLSFQRVAQVLTSPS